MTRGLGIIEDFDTADLKDAKALGDARGLPTRHSV